MRAMITEVRKILSEFDDTTIYIPKLTGPEEK